MTSKKFIITGFNLDTSLRSKLYFAWCIFLISGFYSSFAQDNACHKSTEGTDFWFGIMENIGNDPGHYVGITVTASETTTFKITFGQDEIPFNGEYTVDANNSIQVKIPWDLVEVIGSEEIQNKGIHLTSENPVNVYALNWRTNSSDAALIYPVESLGKEYLTMCYYPDHLEGEDRSNSEFLIVATEDSTIVKITPSKVTDKLRSKDSTFVIKINKGEVYQVQSKNASGQYDSRQGDLTGSYISSNKPVAVYSGAQSTRVPTGTCCWDHLFEQIPPLHSWGLEYYTVPLKSREQDRYRIMAARDNTTVYISGEKSFRLNKGEFKEVAFFYNEPKRILSDKPILVAQYSQSRDVDPQFTGENGDPFMIILSSSDQSKNNVTFVAFDSNQIEKYFVNIITRTDETGNVLFNGNSIKSQFTQFPEGGYSWTQIIINPGTYNIRNNNEGRGFIAYIYGFGGIESYGYGVGFNLDLVLDLGESIDFNGDTLLLCHGDTKTLDAGPYFDTYEWDSGETSQKLEVTEAGKYAVTTSTIDGCILHDSIYIIVKNPQTNIGNDTAFCYPGILELNAGDGFSKYYWQSGDTVQKIVADKTDTYNVTVYDIFGCPARDTMNLEVYPLPKVKIIGDSLICGIYTSKLELEITDAPEEVWNYEGSIKWATDKPDLLSFNIKGTTFVELTVVDWGEYNISLELTTTDGCVVNKNFKVIYHPVPTSLFRFEDDAKCEGYSKKLLYEGEATDSAIFFWDLDGCIFVDTFGWQKYDVSVGAFLSKPPYIQLVINDNGCWSDTTALPLGAKPIFTMDADLTRGCDSLTVNFSSELLRDDNVEFKWEFESGDPVYSQYVQRHYSSVGFYDVTLTITNPITECKNGFTLDSMIKVFQTPTAEFSADPGLCYPDSFDAQYLNYIDSSICYWEFDNCHWLNGENQFIRVQIDNPTANLTLRVDEFGCLSEPVTKSIKRKPHFDFFTENEEGCQPYTLEIIAEPLDSFLEFTWINDTLPDINAPSVIFTLPDSGFYSTLVKGYSTETGCVDSLFKSDWIWVHPKPIADFDVDFPVATIKHADIQFTNKSLYGIYHSWDFGDQQFSDLINPQHKYEEIGEFYPQLITETEYGCLDTTKMLIQVFPFSVFTPNAFRPDSEIPENRTFMPLGIGADPDRFHIMIFDRWGQIVFESHSFEHKWDGKTRNGKNAPMGNYVWKADFFDIQGFEHHQNGQVILIR